ncbi:hypothetical protein LEP1GSC089_3430 [Leptospira interrogans serovar Autumnalis str. LP101]|nr:hypothetical protein LEP1GSC089_3430 [Leptospira interrogans serovar Autumnalis str. LP101]
MKRKRLASIGTRKLNVSLLLALGNSTSRFYWRSETQRLASIGARRIQDRFLDLIDSILLSWKNSITRKALQKNEKNADSKKGKQNVCFSKSQSNNFLKCSIN